MDQTPNLALPYIMPAQAQKHVTHNEALRELDALVQLAVLDRDLATPPASPAEGARYIVAASPTGAWAGKVTQIAAFQDGAWLFYVPREGWLAWVADEDIIVAWSGSAWAPVVPGSGSSVTFAQVGVNATPDTTNRLAVSSAASLFNHAGNGHQQKINKAAAGDTASQLYQSNFSGRAEIGLTGDDNFHFKVSPDGSAFVEALILDKTTGAATYKAGARSTFAHDATNAGLNLVPAAGDPSAPSNGDLWYNSTTGTFRKRQAGATSDLDTSSGYTHPNHTGDVVSVGDGATTIANDAVTNAKMANMAAKTIKARITNSTGDPEDATPDQAAAMLPAAEQEYGHRRAPLAVHDFLHTNSQHGDFTGFAISSGTITTAPAAGVVDGNHPGVILLRSSTSANSGWYFGLGNTGTAAGALLRIAGGERLDLICRTAAAFTNTTVRIGFFDTNTSAAPVDGAWVDFSGSGALTCRTRSNSTESTADPSVTLSADTWYHIRIKVNAGATQVDFEIYNDAGTLLGSASITTNIPTASGRELGAGVIATNSGTTATDLLLLDYMAFGVPGRDLARGALS